MKRIEARPPSPTPMGRERAIGQDVDYSDWESSKGTQQVATYSQLEAQQT